MKECDRIQEAMSLYIDNQLDEKESQWFIKHMEQCETCRQEYDALANVVKTVNTMPSVDLPEGFHDEFMKKVNRELAEPIQLITKKQKESHRKRAKINFGGFHGLDYKKYLVAASSVIITFLMISSLIGLSIKKENEIPMSMASVGFQESAESMDTSAATGSIESERFGEPLIQSYTITIESENFDYALDVVNNLPGYNANSNIINDQDNRHAYISRRVSTENYEEVKNILRALGVVTSESESEEILTNVMLDSEALLRAKDMEVERLFALLEKSGSVSSMMAIEERLNIVESERENVKADLMMHNNNARNAYMYINLMNAQEGNLTIEKTFGEKLQSSFMNSLRICVRVMEWLLVAFSSIFPLLIVVALVGICVYVIRKKSKKERSGCLTKLKQSEYSFCYS